MSDVFHAGELAVQTRAGVTVMASRVGRGIFTVIPDGFRAFLAAQPLTVLAAEQPGERMQIALLGDGTGGLEVPDPSCLAFPDPPAGFRNLAAGSGVAVLVIDLATRQRIRLNGHASPGSGAGLRIDIKEAYGNCPKYIQARLPGPSVVAPFESSSTTPALNASQQALIRASDTFFIASTALGRSDVSHRGGPQGFLQIRDARHLRFDDYPGNTMFNTLGNLAINPQVSLLIPDFVRGYALHLQGTAEVVWASPGQRSVEIALHEVVEQAGALSGQWTFLSASPFNPAAPTQERR